MATLAGMLTKLPANSNISDLLLAIETPPPKHEHDTPPGAATPRIFKVGHEWLPAITLYCRTVPNCHRHYPKLPHPHRNPATSSTIERSSSTLLVP
ncbi:hypothetical protein GMDG_08651, partial [Pseudogymnoascus destructans 20631-21]